MVRPLIASAGPARGIELTDECEPGDGVHRDGQLAVEPRLLAQFTRDVPCDLGGRAVDVLLHGDQPVPELRVVRGGNPELGGDGEEGTREVLPEKVEKCPQAHLPVS